MSRERDNLRHGVVSITVVLFLSGVTFLGLSLLLFIFLGAITNNLQVFLTGIIGFTAYKLIENRMFGILDELKEKL